MDRATSESWEIEEFSGSYIPISFDEEITEDQVRRIRRGFIPRAMEDKWFIYFEEPWLYIHRSWTGLLMYRVKIDLDRTPAAAIVAEITDYEDRPSSQEMADMLPMLLNNFLFRFCAPLAESGP